VYDFLQLNFTDTQVSNSVQHHHLHQHPTTPS
jgi:hypothetical protein